MGSETRDNIKRKRQQRRRRKIIFLFRLMIFLFLFGSLSALVLFAGYHIYTLGSHVYEDYASMYRGYEQRQAEKRGMLDARFDSYTNVLVMGIDDGADPAGVVGKHADTILLLSLDNATGQLRVISIPRDTVLTIPGRKQPEKVSASYAYGGAPLTVQTVSMLLGVSIHQYVTLDVKAMTSLVDALGGVDIYVEDDMSYEDSEAGLNIQLKKGYQHMDGELVQKYLRYRSPELGDIGRVQRQQHFVRALYEQALHLDTVTKLPAIAEIFRQQMTTSAEIFDSAHLAKVLRHLDGAAPKTIMLPGEPNGDAWIPNQERMNEAIKALFPGVADTAGENKNQ